MQDWFSPFDKARCLHLSKYKSTSFIFNHTYASIKKLWLNPITVLFNMYSCLIITTGLSIWSIRKYSPQSDAETTNVSVKFKDNIWFFVNEISTSSASASPANNLADFLKEFFQEQLLFSADKHLSVRFSGLKYSVSITTSLSWSLRQFLKKSLHLM